MTDVNDSNSIRVKCEICNFDNLFTTNQLLIHNYVYHEEKQFVFRCQKWLCDHITVRAKHMQTHYRKYHYANRSLLWIRLKCVEQTEKPFRKLIECPFCNTHVITLEDLDEHYYMIHENELIGSLN